MSGPARTPRGTRVAPGDTPSATYRVEPSQREAMQQELMELGAYLVEHPGARKVLKPHRSARPLDPGVYFNAGTGMVERLYRPQRVALGARYFRVSGDPDAPLEELRRKILEGRG
ncbi:MAG: hypothetical protein AB1425_06110 [Actinomycetota bacterium]